MWANLLSQQPDLFDRDPFLVFGELKAFDLDAGVFDQAWLPQEEPKTPDEDEPVLDDPQLKLFAK